MFTTSHAAVHRAWGGQSGRGGRRGLAAIGLEVAESPHGTGELAAEVRLVAGQAVELLLGGQEAGGTQGGEGCLGFFQEVDLVEAMDKMEFRLREFGFSRLSRVE